ncbi:unnamed protein product [Ectocarpus fasciculatus]
MGGSKRDFLADMYSLLRSWPYLDTRRTLSSNELATLPEGIFGGLTSLEWLYLYENELTTLPEGIFGGLSALEILDLSENEVTTLPEGIFQNISGVQDLYLHWNQLTTLPEGIFGGLTALITLRLDLNSLECLPPLSTTLVELDENAPFWEEGLHVDAYGDECGCSIDGVTDNVCGQNTCTPGDEGYTCADDGQASTDGGTTSASDGTSDVDDGGSTTDDGEAGGDASDSERSTSDSTPIVVGVISAVAGAALVALAVLCKHRRDTRKKAAHPHSAPPAPGGGNLEQGLGPVLPPCFTAALASGKGGDDDKSSSTKHNKPWPPPYAPAEGVAGGDIVPRSAPTAVVFGAAEDRDAAGHRGEGGAAVLTSAKTSTMDTTSTATHSTTNLSTYERAELAVPEAASVASGPRREQASVGGGGGGGGGREASSAADHPNSSDDLGLGHAVLGAAQELARHCQVPGISEAAGVLCIMANLFMDSRDNDRESDSRLRQCRSIVMALERAEKVVGKGGDTTGKVARVLIEDVHEAIFDLVELIKTFQSKNKLSKLFLSTLFKRRQDELDAVVDRAIMRLQLGLQLQVGHDMGSVKDSMKSMEDDVSAVKHGVKAVEEGMNLYRQASQTISCKQREHSSESDESVAEARSIRRQRKLDQVEIPEDQLFITTDLLGKGGFGEVYLADYNGHNAAAKVINIAHDLGALDENQKQRETRQRRGFLRELEAMIRLRSPNTVNVFGAVTSLPDRMVLVMELLPNGDLLTLLRRSKKPLPEERSRQIIGDICAGMAFLHGKNTVHGDLKSANVLLDGGGRAKIGDFGTSRWSQHTNSTGLATYTTKANQSTQMSLAWSAPEVLESGGSTYKSDVYSFGIVVWEVFSRQLPWANKTRPRDILLLPTSWISLRPAGVGSPRSVLRSVPSWRAWKQRGGVSRLLTGPVHNCSKCAHREYLIQNSSSTLCTNNLELGLLQVVDT